MSLRTLGAQVGLAPHAMLTGEAIAALSEEALAARVRDIALFVEVDPQQKERIVRALQRSGEAVGYLGDGINDAPALHAADVGISVDDAVDVAREDADVVLLEPDLDVLRQGVEDGRRTFANTLKYIRMAVSANFGNMVSMALATPFLPFLPLAAKQILVNNFLADLPSMAISTDDVDAERVARPERWDLAELRRFMLLFGLIGAAFDLLTFWVLLRVLHAGESYLQTAWFVVSLLTGTGCRDRAANPGAGLAKLPPGRLLAWGMALAAGVAVALPLHRSVSPRCWASSLCPSPRSPHCWRSCSPIRSPMNSPSGCTTAATTAATTVATSAAVEPHASPPSPRRASAAGPRRPRWRRCAPPSIVTISPLM
jgi:Mg2+-importing ATPase